MAMCQTIEAMTQSIKSHYYLVKLTQLFISVSICSFIFSPSSLFVFLHYFKFYFSTFPFQLFTHNIDKNSMFLLCNGVLVFVGITKSFSGSSSDDDDDDDRPSNLEEELSSQYIDDGSVKSHVLDVEVSKPMLEREEVNRKSGDIDEQFDAHEQEIIEIKTCFEQVQENIEKIIFIDSEEEQGNSQQVLKEDASEVDELSDAVEEEQDKRSETDYFLIEEEEEEGFMLSTEELNKKFEDFIRKMKEDLRIEARRQELVMV